jgi:hypothetical protein
MENLNKYILNKAKEAGICEPGALEIAKAGTVDELLAYYRRGIDFCLEKNFPSNEELVKLGGDKLKAHGIYVDAEVSLKNIEFSVLLGASNGYFTLDGYTVSELYFKGDTKAEINVCDNAFVVIDCFDESSIEINAYGHSKVLVNIYGRAKVAHASNSNAIIKVVHKNKATY